jgi:hypothetical protein
MNSYWQPHDPVIKKITAEQALSVIETREPLGLFYVLENGTYTGIDNSSGNAWTEEFKGLRQCRRWLSDPNIENW